MLKSFISRSPLARRIAVAFVTLAILVMVTATSALAAGGKHYLRCMDLPIAPCAAAKANPFWVVIPEHHAYDRQDMGEYWTNPADNSLWVRLD